MRFLRTPEYDELFSGDPTWVTESIGGIGADGRPLVTRTSFRFLQTLYNLGPGPRTEPDRAVVAPPPARASSGSARRSRSTPARSSTSPTSCMRPRTGDDTAIACCVSAMTVGKQMQFFGARVNLAKALLYAINGGRDEVTGDAGRRPDSRRSPASTSTTTSSTRRTTGCWTGWPTTYVHALNVIHYMHDKYAYERIEMALHDRDVERTMACGIAGLSVAADSPVGGQVRAGQGRSATRPGWPSTTEIEGEYPAYGNNDDRADADRRGAGAIGSWPRSARHPTYRGARPHPVGADHHLQRRLRPQDRQHPGRPPRRRPVRPGRQPDERPRPPRPGRRRAVGRQDPLRPGPGRHLADDHRHPDRARPRAAGADRQPGRHPGRLHQPAAAST